MKPIGFAVPKSTCNATAKAEIKSAETVIVVKSAFFISLVTALC
jgi:hypothetical protein